jgi:PKD repeat protein
MNKLKTLKWTSMLMTVALVIASCGSDDDEKTPAPLTPTANFTSAADADDYLTVDFTNTSTNATSYTWDFGDGTATSAEENPSHTFAETGDYSVKLTAKNSGGEVSTTKTVSVVFKLNNATINGGSAKSWKLKPAAGSFQVGPTIGSEEWFPQGADLTSVRPCLFNDEFIFKTDNVFEYDANGDLWAEAYMGYGDTDKDKCQDESTLPEAAATWGSGTHTYTFTPASGATPAKITVTGTGAFIALPKAKNGSEYSAAPPTTDASVTYDVVSYSNVDNVETLVIAINIGPGYWTFTLVHNNG